MISGEFQRLYRETQFQTKGGLSLDRNSAMWLVRLEAWEMFQREMARSGTVSEIARTRTLMGIPIRVTVDDDPDTPAVQLFMEPVFLPRITK